MSLLGKAAHDKDSGTNAGPIALKVLLGVALITLSAKVSIDLGPVPITMQTLTLLWLAGLMKTGTALLTVFTYWSAATLGLPVLAGPDGHLGATFGATGGYLLGFFPACVLVARYCEQSVKPLSYVPLAAQALTAHAIIVLCGGLWLGFSIDWLTAWSKGVTPFLLPALIKSGLAAGFIIICRRALYGERPLSHPS